MSRKLKARPTEAPLAPIPAETLVQESDGNEKGTNGEPFRHARGSLESVRSRYVR